MYTYEEIKRIKEEAEKELFKNPDVTGVGIGRKKSNNQLTEDISIIVYVKRKKAASEVLPENLIPPTIQGIKTDVEESDAMITLANTGGIYIESDANHKGGTLGCFAFTTESTPRAVLVTNQHVVMRKTSTTPLNGEVGPTVCSICSSCCSKILGNVLNVILTPVLDGATALLKPGVQIVPEIEGIGVVRGTHVVTVAEANTGTYAIKMYSQIQEKVVTGTVRSIAHAGDSYLDKEHTELHRHFTDQMSIIADEGSNPFAVEGDSGSAILNNNNEVVAIVASSNLHEHATACPINFVESLLKIHIFKGTASGQVYTVPPAATPHTSGPAVFSNQVLTGGINISSNTRHLNTTYRSILKTTRGREYEALFRMHMDEVRTLVNTNRRVATVWHRNRGPAFIIHFSKSISQPSYCIPDKVKSVTLQMLFSNMANILKQYGSRRLAEDIDTHLPNVLKYSGCNNVGKIIAMLNEESKNTVDTTQNVH